MKSLTPLSDRTLLHGMRLFSEINRLPASSLSTQAQRASPRSANGISAAGLSPAIEIRTLSCSFCGLASCRNESKSIALSKMKTLFGCVAFTNCLKSAVCVSIFSSNGTPFSSAFCSGITNSVFAASSKLENPTAFPRGILRS